MSLLRKEHAARIAHYEEPNTPAVPTAAPEQLTALIEDRSGNVRDRALDTLRTGVDAGEGTLEAQLSLIAGADLSNKEGRQVFSAACSQARKIEGMRRSVSGRNTPSQFSSQVSQALRANPSLQGLLTAQDERTTLDVRTLTPKVISALRHLVQNTVGINIKDGFGVEDADSKLGVTTVSVELSDGEKIEAQIALEHPYLSVEAVNTLLNSAQGNQQWVVFVGNGEFKLLEEMIAIPDAQRLVSRGRKEFLLVLNTLLEQRKTSNNASVRIFAVPTEAGDSHLAGIRKLAEFPLVVLKSLGQRRVVGLDKKNSRLFEDLERRSSEGAQ